MKIRLLCLAFIAMCFACSSPKVASYKFDYHDYNAGRKSKEVEKEVAADPGPMPVVAEELIAMETTPTTQTTLSKKQQRIVVKKFKKEIKPYIIQETKAIDHDLKLAAIFGSVGFVGLLLGSLSIAFSIIGGVSLIIGVVFFVKWLIRQ